MDSIVDLDDFRLPDHGRYVETETSRRRRRAKAKWFLKGPISGPWITCAAELPGRALQIALAIQHASAIEKRNRIRLTPRYRDLFGINRRRFCEGLDRLEAAGLIKVDRSSGASPIVTILDWPAPEEGGPCNV